VDKISPKDFERLNLRVGTIRGVQKHPLMDEYILLIDLGPADQDIQVVADLKESYSLKALIGKQVLVIENVQPELIRGVETQGMLLITHMKGKPVLLSPEKKVEPGVQVAGLFDIERYYHHEPGKGC